MFEDVLNDLLKGYKPAKELNAARSDERKNRATISSDKFLPLTHPPFSGKACFVDGGNAAVYASPDCRVELVSVYGTVYEGKRRMSTKKVGGVVVVQNITRDGEERIEAKGYHPLEIHITIPCDDAELRFGREHVTLATVANLCRFILECRFAAELARETACELIVRDGSLEGINKYEEQELLALMNNVENIVGLSKTTTLLAPDGTSTAAALLEAGPTLPWRYDIGELVRTQNTKKEERKKGVVAIVKLHDRSDHCFRCDIISTDTDAIISYLASLSADPVFPGYPYTLIEADRMARISNQDLETAKMRFRVEAGAHWKELQRRSRGLDAHSILDRIS